MMFKPTLVAISIALSLGLVGCNSDNDNVDASGKQPIVNPDIDMGANPAIAFDDMDLTRYVNPFIGTGELGNTYPGATTPHGMVQLSPNNGSNGWEYISGYFYKDARMVGFSHTHLSGAGAGDLNDILVMPINTRSDYMLNEGSASLNVEASTFQHKNESATAGYYTVLLDSYDIKAELTASDRVGVHRYTFPQDEKSELIVNLGFKLNWDYTADSYFKWDKENNRLLGHRFSDGWAPSQKEFFIMEFDQPIKNIRFAYYDKDGKEYVDAPAGTIEIGGEIRGKHQYARAYVEFDTAQSELVVEAKLALSNVEIGENGESGASLNMTEVAGKDFDQVRKDATAKWEKELAKIKVEGDHEYKQTFYSALYHSLLGQTIHSDLDGRYRAVTRGRGAYPNGEFDNPILHDPVLIADANNDGVGDYTRYDTFSLWDTYRSVQPLSSIIEPDRLADVVLSFLSFAELKDESGNVVGRLPEWTFKGNETGMMMGMHSTPIIADVLTKGSLEKRMIDLGFSERERQDIKERLIDAMIKDGREDSAVDSIKEYVTKGYKSAKLREGEGDLWAHSPFESSWTASYSLEYAYNDWCIAQAIKAVRGDKVPEYQEFADRSNNWKAQFDFGGAKYQGWFKARDTEGKFIDAGWVDPETGKAVGKDWRPDMFNYAFTESNGWQYSFSVQHDIHGLINHMTKFDQEVQDPKAQRGDLFAARLDEYFSTYPDRNAGDNQYPIFNTGNLGQHVQGNEPDHHVPYLYNYVGQPWKTQAAVVSATNVCYNNTPDGICGNDDFGTMSSWFVFRALGFYPVSASAGIYEIGTPMFESANIDVGNGKTFTVTTDGISRDAIFIQSATLNGKAFTRTYLTHDEIMAGGTLHFVMGEKPNKEWGTGKDDVPPNLGVGSFLHANEVQHTQ
nr:GH92 family glycosyl hydrolase [Photobacterium damselae]